MRQAAYPPTSSTTTRAQPRALRTRLIASPQSRRPEAALKHARPPALVQRMTRRGYRRASAPGKRDATERSLLSVAFEPGEDRTRLRGRLGGPRGEPAVRGPGHLHQPRGHTLELQCLVVLLRIAHRRAE